MLKRQCEQNVIFVQLIQIRIQLNLLCEMIFFFLSYALHSYNKKEIAAVR